MSISITKNKWLLFLTLMIVATTGFSLMPTQKAAAQQVDFGSDFVNRYVWRGIDFGKSASIQPYIEFTSGGFTAGTWASYAISPVENSTVSAVGASEHDLYLSYNFGNVSVGVTDYYFPTGSEFFNFDDNGDGAHIIEPNVSLTGPESFPLTFYGAINAYNDPDHSIYLEASVPFTVGDTEMSVTAGGVPTESAYYGTTKAGLININLSVSREIEITEKFSLPIFGGYILNPYAEQSYLVFGLSL
ncbi:TorF family putative porin [Fodinibius sp. SL11]|uniref:TorF family putative porin n=1 Tax=Fodinibius sp. SL11 TaxID=3425690 RepID=UPI003F881FB0